MTIGSGVPYNAHTGNGITTTFAYGFTLLDADDLVVTVNGVATTAFTITGLGVAAGGTVIFSAAPANGAAIGGIAGGLAGKGAGEVVNPKAGDELHDHHLAKGVGAGSGLYRMCTSIYSDDGGATFAVGGAVTRAGYPWAVWEPTFCVQPDGALRLICRNQQYGPTAPTYNAIAFTGALTAATSGTLTATDVDNPANTFTPVSITGTTGVLTATSIGSATSGTVSLDALIGGAGSEVARVLEEIGSATPLLRLPRRRSPRPLRRRRSAWHACSRSRRVTTSLSSPRSSPRTTALVSSASTARLSKLTTGSTSRGGKFAPQVVPTEGVP